MEKITPYEKRDSQGRLHCEDGPALVNSNGTVEYWIHGVRHREDGPAVVEKASGIIFKTCTVEKWYFEGKLHRTDGPAIVMVNECDGGYGDVPWKKKEEWWVGGLLHRENEPAIITDYGYVEHDRSPVKIEGKYKKEEWYSNGGRHRDNNEPAMIFSCEKNNGSIIKFAQSWWVHDDLHREDGPAFFGLQIKHKIKENIWKEVWAVDGYYHRIGGPAVIRQNGEEEYWEMGVFKKKIIYHQ